VKKDTPKPFEIQKNSIGMEFVWIPAGEFMMGRKTSLTELRRQHFGEIPSKDMIWWGEKDTKNEVPRHLVKITKGFWMGRHEVTQAQYKAIMGKNPSFCRYKCLHCNKLVDPRVLKDNVFSEAMQNHPVEDVTWFQTTEFCRKLGDKEGQEYSLPTEAQWEYACRAGTTTVFSFGDDYSKLGEYAWYNDNCEETTHPVGQKKPNAWGLFDMHGNVSEWCLDRFDPNSYTNKVAIDPVCSKAIKLKADLRVERGGDILTNDMGCRSAKRGWFYNFHLFPGLAIGFRVICQNLEGATKVEKLKSGEAIKEVEPWNKGVDPRYRWKH